MKFTATTIFAAATSFALVSAQSIADLPSCALPCFTAAIPDSGCGPTDVVCQCTTGQAKLQAAVAACLPSKCSAADQEKTLQESEAICAKAGVTISVSAFTAAATGSATGKASSGAQSTMTMTTTGSATTSASSTGTAAAQSTGGAADMRGSMLGLGAALVGAAILGL